MVASHNITIGTDNTQAPRCARHWLIAYYTVGPIYLYQHTTLLATSHLVAQYYQVRLLTGIGTSKDGLIEQTCRVWMYKVAPLLIYHHKIRVRIRFHLRH